MHESSLAQEFVLEGEQIRARKSVLAALAIRFGGKKIRKEFGSTLQHITNLERLDELFALAIRARRLSQFRKALQDK